MVKALSVVQFLVFSALVVVCVCDRRQRPGNNESPVDIPVKMSEIPRVSRRTDTKPPADLPESGPNAAVDDTQSTEQKWIWRIQKGDRVWLTCSYRYSAWGGIRFFSEPDLHCVIVTPDLIESVKNPFLE